MTAVATKIPAQPAWGTRVAYLADGQILTGTVKPYEMRGGLFPVQDDRSPVQRMMLASECVPAEQAEMLRGRLEKALARRAGK